MKDVVLATQAFHCDFGQPTPMGPTCVAAHCWNFAVYAPDATALWLCLYCPDTEEPLAELPFLAKTGEVWHLQVSSILNDRYVQNKI